jgi:microcystin-dependent protein
MAQAWLTPDESQLSESQVERTIRLPGSLWSYVTGALALLAEDENWEEFGDATPEDTAQFFADVLDDYAMSSFRNVGMIAAFSVDGAVPPGWLFMNGQAVAQADYPELTAACPAAWQSGGNITLPDCRQRFLVGSGIGALPNIGTGTIGGANTHTLTTSEMPAHNHTYLSPGTATLVAAPGEILAATQAATANTGNAGSGVAHNNTPAYLAIRWWIYAGR